MKKNIILIHCLSIIVFQIADTFAQQTNLQFYDVQTGFAIVPDEMLIYDSDSEILDQYQKKEILKERVSLNLKQGQYAISINLAGYKQMNIDFKVKDDAGVTRKIMLSPNKIPGEISYDYIRSLQQPDQTIIVGYVADENGFPLPGAILESENGNAVYTNEEGYFQLSLSYDKADQYDMQLKNFTVRKAGYQTAHYIKVVVVPNGDAIYRIQLQKGSGTLDYEMSNFIVKDGEVTGKPTSQMTDPSYKIENIESTELLKSANACLPETVSVGYITGGKCCSDCTRVIDLTLEDYVKQVLDDEWLGGWRNLDNIEESYKAAAVAVRTFASFRVNDPRKSGVYDIGASICDQVWTPSETTWATAAGNATKAIILKRNGEIKKAEYSSENNNLSGFEADCSETLNGEWVTAAGCGNGKFQDEITGDCFDDPLGKGWVQFGHGRNMSQFGSARWATGLALGFWCNSPFSGAPHSYGKKSWKQILDRYYPYHELVFCDKNENENDHPLPPIVEDIINEDNCTANITTTVGNLAAKTYEASNNISSTGTVNSGIVNFKSPGIDLKNGFTVSGGIFYAENVSCTSNKTAQTEKGLIEMGIYPNPVNQQANISFTLSEEQAVSIWVNDISGRLISTIIHKEVKTAGQHQISFKVANHSTGIYYVTVQANKDLMTEKMIITK